MILAQRQKIDRRAFTLIELLVVIAIIAVLVSLTAAAVMRFFAVGTRTANAHDMSQLQRALEEFKAKYHVYPPDQILLANTRSAYDSHPLGKKSFTYLSKIWPNLDFNGLDWSGDGSLPASGVVLEGDQCLVFFLGGIQSKSPKACLGFSANPKSPTKLTANGNKLLPMYDFKAARLYQRGGSPFFSYLDAYADDANTGKPYIYFSSGLAENAYNPNYSQLGVKPYIRTTTPYIQFFSPKTFQLISAGEDLQFGPGGTYDPANPVVPQQAMDDVASFVGGGTGLIGAGE